MRVLLLIGACVVLPFALGLTYGIAQDRWTRRRVARPHLVIDAQIQQTARDNYWLLLRAVRVLQQVLDDDAVLPSMTKTRRDELLAVVSEFNQQDQKGITT